ERARGTAAATTAAGPAPEASRRAAATRAEAAAGTSAGSTRPTAARRARHLARHLAGARPRGHVARARAGAALPRGAGALRGTGAALTRSRAGPLPRPRARTALWARRGRGPAREGVVSDTGRPGTRLRARRPWAGGGTRGRRGLRSGGRTLGARLRG